MLIYNSNKEFIGIDEKDLKNLGFSNLAQLKSESEDFADLFMRTTGYIHNFAHVHWIDFVECADASQESKVIIKVNGASFEASLIIETLYLSSHPSSKSYLIHLHNLTRLGAGASIPSMPAFKEPSQPEKRVPEVSQQSKATQHVTPTLMETTPVISDEPLDLNTYDDDDVFVSPQPTASPQEEEYEDDGYVFDPHVASEQLGLPIDLIEEFIQDFIAQAKEFKDELYTSLEDEDIANIATLSHKLKGVAANLRIENALNTLIVINESKDINTIESNLKHFYNIVAKLSGEELKVAQNESFPTVDNHTDEDDEFVLDFKEEQAEVVESKPEITPENIEVDEEEFVLELDDDVFAAQEPSTSPKEPETQEQIETPLEEDDELILDFKEETKDEALEIHDEDVPDKIDMPELEDDDFITPEVFEEVLEVEDDFSSVEVPAEVAEVAEEEIVINYSKELIANSIGLDMETFDEILDDYVTDTTTLSLEIHEALAGDDFESCSKKAVMIKGMSESIHMKSFEEEIECLIQANDKEEMIRAIARIDKIIKQISIKA